MTAGLVLAGGASRRMGQPKALLTLGGQTLVERMVRLFLQFCDRVWLVTGEHHDAITTAVPAIPATVTFNSRHADGMFTSIQCGLRSCAGADSVLFSPVDFASVSATTIARLFAAPPHAVVKPRFQGRSGHPVLLDREAIHAVLAAPATANAKQILSHLPALYVEVDDPGVAEDCDTPADYARLLARWKDSHET
jgi:CTP:molybdopterin cytidylyltransferase MocA